LIEIEPPVSILLVAGLLVCAGALALAGRRIIGKPHRLARLPGLVLLRGTVFIGLLAAIANPVRVERDAAETGKTDVVYLLDASASMALGEGPSRFQDAVEALRRTHRKLQTRVTVEPRIFTFGERIEAVPAGALGLVESASPAANADPPAPDGRAAPHPVQADTRLLEALRMAATRLGRSHRRPLVVFSDGQARETAAIEDEARRSGQEGMPIHVYPVGKDSEGGDAAVVSLVVPERVRKHSQVPVRVWVRSYGYGGIHTRLTLSTQEEGEAAPRMAEEIPVTLRSGIQSFQINFRSGLRPTTIRASIAQQPGELSAANNAKSDEVLIDRTKIRVLIIEGDVAAGNAVVTDQPFMQALSPSPLAAALSGDLDIESTVLRQLPGGSLLRDLVVPSASFPASPALLFAYDAVIFNDAPASVLREQQEAWIEEWIAGRGGGLCMVGGPRSFAAGGWRRSRIAEILPVAFGAEGSDWSPAEGVSFRPVEWGSPHPIWSIVSDPSRNRDLLERVPTLRGLNGSLRAKPGAEVLASGGPPAGGNGPLLICGSYGRGRSLAIGVPVCSAGSGGFLESWGPGGAECGAKFWRNVVYWLTENSSTGRRRLVASTDKLSYRPGQKIRLDAIVYDEAARTLADARVFAVVEPADLQGGPEGDASPICWPEGVPREGGEKGLRALWGEEIPIRAKPDASAYGLDIPIASELPAGTSSSSLRLEVSAYDDDALIDSVAIDVQVVEDPYEQRNPLANHDLLRSIARLSGGRVVEDPDALAGLILESGSEGRSVRIRHRPLWNEWWILAAFLALLGVEWIWRRFVGLA